MIPQEDTIAKTLDTVPKVNFSTHTQEESYAIARLLMDADKFMLSLIGQENNQSLFNLVYAILVFLLAVAVGYVVRKIVVAIVHKIGEHFQNDLYKGLLNAHFFTKTSRIIPPIVFLILIQFTLTSRATLSSWLSRLSYIWMAFVIAYSICILLEVIWIHIDERANKKKLPLHGLVQVAKGIVWIVCAIIVIAVLFDRSPGALLTGLGAFATVLMLIFKDSILGIVAGVQLSENESLHVGDWIKVHGTDANGTVIEVSLNQVKIRNWDKTITTVPPYNLISGSFTNYRTMQESNTRRIQRSYMIDADSVIPTDDKLLEEFAKIPLIKDWIAKKIEQREAGKVCNASNPEGLVDGSIESNLGVFRAYLKLWLDANPEIDHSGGIGFCFVTTLPQTANGIPLQIYCFTATSAWLQYEAIMASVFEHIAVMMYKFHLYTYESASGRDTLMDGWMSPGKNPDVLFGMPYPFFNASGTPENPAYPVQQTASPQPSAMTPPAAPSQASPSPSLSGGHGTSATPSPSGSPQSA